MRIREIDAGETHVAFAAMRELRSHLTDAGDFAERVDRVMRPEGYRLVGAFEDADDAGAVAGFRVMHSLVAGRHVYVDDLATAASARRRGHGRALLDWLVDEARRLGCDALQLDSRVGPERADAHRLYLNARYTITAHHFVRAVDS